MSISACSHDISKLAECPIWDFNKRRLLYLDLLEPRIIEFTPHSGATRSAALPLRPPLGGLCLRSEGSYLVFNRDGAFVVGDDLAVIDNICPPHGSFAFAPPNDVAVHSSGCILVATADLAEADPTGALLCLTPNGGWHRLIDGLTVGNGPAFCLDNRTIYLADSPKGIIYSYDFDAEALSMSNRRVFAKVPPEEGLPDGLSVDTSGCLWSARWGGRAVARYTPNGTERDRIAVPARYVTSCAFGGDDLKTLFITTARSSAAEPSGSGGAGGQLFMARVQVAGDLLPCAGI
jgi:sugar lactone lactonase YvrE